MIERTATTKTDNTGIHGLDNDGEPNDPVKIQATSRVQVLADYEEACEWFGGELKVQDVLQAEAVRRQSNAVRAVIRGIDNPDTDWDAVGEQIANSYTPGRKGGFQAPSFSADELADVAGDTEALMALLQSRGATVS